MNLKSYQEVRDLKGQYLYKLSEGVIYKVTSATNNKVVLNKGLTYLTSIFFETKQNEFRFATAEEISDFKSLENYREIEKAKAFLKEQGFQTDNLWCVDDVKAKFNCTDEQAQHVLYRALTNDATMEQIWLAIDIIGEAEGLEPIEEN